MKICVIGSRGIENFDLGPYIPREASLIVTGGARGVDTLAEEYANKNGISKKTIRLSGYNDKKSGAYFVTVCTNGRKCIMSRIVGEGLCALPYNILTPIGRAVENSIQ
jgi:hypothetical protein